MKNYVNKTKLTNLRNFFKGTLIINVLNFNHKSDQYLPTYLCL